MKTLKDLTPGNTFIFEGDDKYMRWVVLEAPTTWKKFLKKHDKTFCIMTEGYRSGLKHIFGQIQTIPYPNECTVTNVRKT